MPRARLALFNDRGGRKRSNRRNAGTWHAHVRSGGGSRQQWMFSKGAVHSCRRQGMRLNGYQESSERHAPLQCLLTLVFPCRPFSWQAWAAGWMLKGLAVAGKVSRQGRLLDTGLAPGLSRFVQVRRSPLVVWLGTYCVIGLRSAKPPVAGNFKHGQGQDGAAEHT